MTRELIYSRVVRLASTCFSTSARTVLTLQFASTMSRLSITKPEDLQLAYQPRECLVENLPEDIILHIASLRGDERHVPRHHRVLHILSLLNHQFRAVIRPLLLQQLRFNDSIHFRSQEYSVRQFGAVQSIR